MDISSIIPHIEALIFASEKPLTALELTELINNAFGFMEDKINLDQVESAIEGIIEKYAASFYPFEMKESGGGWQFLTKKDYHKTVAQLNGEKFLKRLSAASLETLAIIAYKQPITKGEVESIRGVNSDYSIQKLLEKELIVITGRNEELPGKPLVYATSKSFMDYFGINSPEELPRIKEVFMEQGVEATVVMGKENGEDKVTEEDVLPEEAPTDDVALVVRGNGELIEEPQLVVNENTEAVDPEIFETIEEDLPEENERPEEEVPGNDISEEADTDEQTPEDETLEDETLEDETLEDETLDDETLDEETLDEETLEEETLKLETLDDETLDDETLKDEILKDEILEENPFSEANEMMAGEEEEEGNNKRDIAETQQEEPVSVDESENSAGDEDKGKEEVDEEKKGGSLPSGNSEEKESEKKEE